MIYFIGILSGFTNGFFACGAGQIIIFYLVFLKKMETHKARGTSILVLSITSIVSLIYYLFKVKVEMKRCIIVAVISIFSGIIASRIMNKMNSKYLNLISGALMTSLTIISIFRG